ncbi:MAG: hypothetical protein LBP22_15235 [Deltaproteobacteria bacterium]|jgi:hypothetical protein|nr:hypothetical protein [Deltaproteobacteria bacterium]
MGFRINVSGADSSDAPADVVPADDYTCLCRSVKQVESKSGSRYISTVWKVTEGEYEGASIFGLFFFEGSDENFRERNKALMAKLLEACSLNLDVDSDRLVGRKCVLTVTIEPAKDGYAEKNWVTNYKPVTKSYKAGPKMAAPSKTGVRHGGPPEPKRPDTPAPASVAEEDSPLATDADLPDGEPPFDGSGEETPRDDDSLVHLI